MDKLFLQIINMSITSSYVILFVIIIRLFIKKLPKIFSYALWFVVLFRLISPVSFEGIISLIPASTVVPQDIAYMPKPEINSGIVVIDNSINNILPSAAPAASANPMQIWLAIGEAVWILGIILLIIYSILATVKLYIKLRGSIHITDNIYETHKIKTPFVFGIVNPKIYIPDHLFESERSYVLLHEQTHIKRLDHIVKLTFFLVTCIHWFNPFAWIAFFLMGEDMELSCDESVVKQMGSDIKKEYSSSLLSMSTGRKIIGGSPIAFGENNTKGRIKNVLNYKKPKIWVAVVSIIIVLAIGIGLMSNPKTVTLNNTANNFSLESLDRVTSATLISGNSVVNLSTAKAMQIAGFIKELKVNKKEVSLERGGGRDSSNQIHMVFEGFGNDGTLYDIYFNFNADFTEVWVDNGVKPSFSYKVKKPNEVKVLFDKEVADAVEEIPENTNYEKLSAYLKEKSINTFSLYYELLDFKISDYQEEIVDGNVEAIFSYTIVHKNYDRDPDTVQYIKEAKERGDKNYQIYYDEYLQPQDMNIYFKAVIDENDTITLYTKNPAIENDDWREVEMSDFVIGKITEKHESEKRNRNEQIDNDIAEYISYDYEYRSIYIAGLKIFEEFTTEEFGNSNEGSARIIDDENAMEFFITTSTGLVPAAGSITGPEVYFKMDLDTKEIVEKKLTPAPNYAEAAELYPEHINPDSIQYSEKIIELNNERIVEIGEYLFEFILGIESELDYFIYED